MAYLDDEEQKPPDLDASGNPVDDKPPDLDATGNPVTAPKKSLTLVDALDSISAKMRRPHIAGAGPIGALMSLPNALLTLSQAKEVKKGFDPLVNLKETPIGKIATMATEKAPILGGATSMGLDIASDLTSPFNLGMTAAGLGEGAAAIAGYPKIASLFGAANRIASLPFTARGVHTAATAKTWPEFFTGGLEALGGAANTLRSMPGEVGRQVPARIASKLEKPNFRPLVGTDFSKGVVLDNPNPDFIKFMIRNDYEVIGEIPNPMIPSGREIVFKKVTNPQAPVIRPPIPNESAFLTDLMNSSKTVMASIDVSAPFRQGLGLIHKKEFWQNFGTMFKALGSQKGFDTIMDGIVNKPSYKLSQDAGLVLTGLGNNITRHEESFLSGLAKTIPGIPASERAYTAFLNKTRADVFESLVKDAQRLGYQPETNLATTKAIAGFINSATGRGPLGALEKHADALNNFFFSPRLIASRLNLMGKPFSPSTYLEMSPLVRQEYLKSLFSIAGAGLTLTHLGKQAADVIPGLKATIENDPRSPDYQKLKIGNTRLDPFGGFQQYLVLASKLLTGESKSSTSNKVTPFNTGKFGEITYKDALETFVTGKVNPLLGFAYAMLRGHEPSGERVGMKDITDPQQWSPNVMNRKNIFENPLAQRFIPLMLQDIYELAKYEPELLPLSLFGAFGAGIQTYKPKSKQ